MNAIKSQTRKVHRVSTHIRVKVRKKNEQRNDTKRGTGHKLKGNENWIPMSPCISNTGHRKAMKQNLKTDNW